MVSQPIYWQVEVARRARIALMIRAGCRSERCIASDIDYRVRKRPGELCALAADAREARQSPG